MPPRRLDALGVTVDQLRRIPSPVDRLRAIKAVRSSLAEHVHRLEDVTRDAILEARAQDPPLSFEEVGTILGVTRQRAAQLAEARPGR